MDHERRESRTDPDDCHDAVASGSATTQTVLIQLTRSNRQRGTVLYLTTRLEGRCGVWAVPGRALVEGVVVIVFRTDLGGGWRGEGGACVGVLLVQ